MSTRNVASLRFGIDLGGSKIEIVALDKHTNQECYRKRIATPSDYDVTLRAIEGLVLEAELKLAATGSVGVGIPGSVCQQQQVVKNANSLWLNGQPLVNDLSSRLARDVRVANDANCFAISEATHGAAKGAHCVFGVIIGTGCGGGIVVDGKPLHGANGLGGEWGHNPLPFPKVKGDVQAAIDYFDTVGAKPPSALYQHKPKPNYHTYDDASWEYPGPLCYCSKRGCLETWISGTGFQNDYQRTTGQPQSAQAIVSQARGGDLPSMAALDRYCERLARALAQVINIIDPDVIVLGGGMSNVQELYERVPEYWQAYTFSDYDRTTLVPAMHGDSSGVFGAAWLWG